MTILPATKGLLSSEMNDFHLSKSADLRLRAIPPLTALLAFERRFAVEFPPGRARSGAQSVGDQPSNPRTGSAVRREAFCPRRALGAIDRGRRAPSRARLGGAGGAARNRAPGAAG